ncbi:MAG TPA: hypothetical protein VIF62_15220 [Labilithrix sp.]
MSRRLVLAAPSVVLVLGVWIGCSTVEDAPVTHPPATTDSGGGGSDSGGGGDGASGGCLTEDMNPPDCDTIDNGCDGPCNDFSRAYTSGVARDIASCLAGLPNCDDAAPIHACADASIAKACDKSGAALLCTPLVAACSKDAGPMDAGKMDAGDGGDAGDMPPPMKSSTVFDEATCERIMKALSPDGQQGFGDCLDNGNAGQCTDDPGGCVDQIRE